MEPEQAPKPRFLTDVIVDLGYATPEKVKEAIEVARLRNQTADQVLLEQGLLTEEQLSHAVAERYGIEYIDLSSYEVDWEAARLVTRSVARRCHAVPIAFSGNDGLVVAIADPAGGAAAGDIAALTRLQVRPVVALKHDIDALIEQLSERERPREPRAGQTTSHEQQSTQASQQASEASRAPSAPSGSGASQDPDMVTRLRKLADPDQDVDLSPELKLVQEESDAADLDRHRQELQQALTRLAEVELLFRQALDEVSEKLRVAGDLLGGTGHLEEMEKQLHDAEAARDAAEAERDELRRRLAAIRDTLSPGS